MSLSHPTFPICLLLPSELKPTPLLPCPHPAAAMDSQAPPISDTLPSPSPLLPSLPGQLSSSPLPMWTQTKADPSPALPCNFVIFYQLRKRRWALLWMAQWFSNCAPRTLPGEPLCVTGATSLLAIHQAELPDFFSWGICLFFDILL